MTVGRGQALVLAEGIFPRFSPLPMALNTSAAASVLTGHTSVAATVTTTVANTILLAIVATDNRVSGAAAIITVNGVADSRSLTWTKRKSEFLHVTVGGINNFDIEVWWAVATVAQSYAVTATLSGSVNNGALIHVLAVKGVKDQTNPWDTNATMFAAESTYQSGSVAQAPISPAFSTDDATTFCFAAAILLGANTAAVGALAGTTATKAQENDAVGTETDCLISEYRLLTTKAASATAAFVQTNNFSYALVADALAG